MLLDTQNKLSTIYETENEEATIKMSLDLDSAQILMQTFLHQNLQH